MTKNDKCFEDCYPGKKICLDCEEQGVFEDSYVLLWRLRDTETGEAWNEVHRNMSLSDFEVLYGMNVNEILVMHLIKENGWTK